MFGQEASGNNSSAPLRPRGVVGQGEQEPSHITHQPPGGEPGLSSGCEESPRMLC